jgi:DNA-binding CsgD family transcriptional regulator
MADYSDDDYYTPTYEITGQTYLDSALKYCNPELRCYYSLLGLKNLRLGNITRALKIYSTLLSKFELSSHDFAVETSSMAHIYRIAGRHNEADFLLAQAAIEDIKESTKETIALRNLADNQFEKGDIERAYRYINLALDDAYFYEARHRKVKISDIIPHIEKERLKIVQKQKKNLLVYSSVVTILSITILLLSVIIFRQFSNLKVTRNELAKSNDILKVTNTRLREVNRIKEEYIGYFFNVNSVYIEKIEKLKKSITRKLATNNYQDIQDILRNMNLKKEREELFVDFDKSFLKIFPNFIERFNQLFKQEDRFTLEKDQILSPEIRIFALIRLGIKENEKIAHILNYSLNTIYTYKTKIKNRAIVTNEEFEDKIMEIRAI